ncbi:MAG: MarR family winged helix-turn-helix transcriptional regulator [Acidobacteriota bacterium]
MTNDRCFRIHEACTTPFWLFWLHTRRSTTRVTGNIPARGPTSGRISSRDAWILGHLHRTRPVSPSRLAAHLSVRPSTVSEAVSRLESLGYLCRRQSGTDRRRQELLLTARGADAMAGASVLDRGQVRRLLALLPPARRADAVKGLELLAEAARALNARQAARPTGGAA